MSFATYLDGTPAVALDHDQHELLALQEAYAGESKLGILLRALVRIIRDTLYALDRRQSRAHCAERGVRVEPQRVFWVRAYTYRTIRQRAAM